MGDLKDRGSTFRAKIEVLESMGSELYAHFTVASDATIESDTRSLWPAGSHCW